jgi:hypothetical protein
MHSLDGPSALALPLTCYCDDSGSHDESAAAVVGTVLTNKEQFIGIDREWTKIKREFRIDGIHMADFVRPYGRYCTMPPEMKIALFTSVARAINENKICSVASGVPQVEFRSFSRLKCTSN